MPGRALSELLAAVEEMRLRERGELARLLHDEAGGRLTATAVDLTLLRMDAPAELQPQLDALEKKLELAFETVRNVSLSTAPDLASRVPFSEALSKLGASASRRFAGRLEFSVDSEYYPEPELSVALYRIAELLVNFFAIESAADVVQVTVRRDLVLTVEANLPISRENARGNLGITLARLLARKHNLRFMLGIRPSASTIFLIGGQAE